MWNDSRRACSARRARCGDRRVSRGNSGAARSGESRTGGESATAGKAITTAECTAERLGSSIAASAIGEPVRSVTLSAPSWVESANGAPAHCRVNGSMAPIDTASTARPINFSVVLPASWSRRAAQLGGGGMNGIIPNLTGGGPGAQGPSLLDRGFATYGSDSGHQAAFGARGGAGRGIAARSQRLGRLDAQRGGHQEPRLRADEEDARCRDGRHRACVWRATTVQLLHREVTRRTRGVDSSAAVSRPTTTASPRTCPSSSFSTSCSRRS